MVSVKLTNSEDVKVTITSLVEVDKTPSMGAPGPMFSRVIGVTMFLKDVVAQTFSMAVLAQTP